MIIQLHLINKQRSTHFYLLNARFSILIIVNIQVRKCISSYFFRYFPTSFVRNFHWMSTLRMELLDVLGLMIVWSTVIMDLYPTGLTLCP